MGAVAKFTLRTRRGCTLAGSRPCIVDGLVSRVQQSMHGAQPGVELILNVPPQPASKTAVFVHNNGWPRGSTSQAVYLRSIKRPTMLSLDAHSACFVRTTSGKCAKQLLLRATTPCLSCLEGILATPEAVLLHAEACSCAPPVAVSRES